MKKITLIFLLTFLVSKFVVAQSGIDVAFVPFFKNYFREPIIERLYPNQLGLKIGFFKWEREDMMRSLNLYYASSSDVIKTDIYDYFDRSYYKRDFDYSNKAYILNYEIYLINTEIDMKTNFYYKVIYFVGYVESSIKGATIVPITANEFDATKEYRLKDYVYSDFIFGYGLGAGFQYNLTKKIGFYTDINTNVGLYGRFQNISSIVNINVGTKIRIK
ncbi:MAG: hypothetical protein ACOYMA_02180 [Bacteroidia bacterium]